MTHATPTHWLACTPCPYTVFVSSSFVRGKTIYSSLCVFKVHVLKGHVKQEGCNSCWLCPKQNKCRQIQRKGTSKEICKIIQHLYCLLLMGLQRVWNQSQLKQDRQGGPWQVIHQSWGWKTPLMQACPYQKNGPIVCLCRELSTTHIYVYS